MKLIYAREDGRILGAQAIGSEGVEKRIDVIAMAIQNGATVFDIEEAELSYSPQVGSAKDPVNLAGMIGANSLRGDAPLVRWEDIETTDAFILDVRFPDEYKDGEIPGAVKIPLPVLRRSLDKLPRDRQIWVFCASGKRSYYATRALRLHGFDARNLSGGILTRKAWQLLQK
jgi:rhodanese-related sulfurtransferase